MNLIELNVNRISYSQSQNGAYALILEEVDGERKLPIVIGGFEAQSIAIALDKNIEPPRPLTHDLFKTFSKNFEINIKQVIIHKLIDGIFYSSLICERDKVEEIIDARTSDAVALSIRFNTPIFTYENILKKAGFKNDKSNLGGENDHDQWIKNCIKEQTSSDKEKDFSKIALKDLKALLKKFVKEEDYESAAKVRDELSLRKKG